MLSDTLLTAVLARCESVAPGQIARYKEETEKTRRKVYRIMQEVTKKIILILLVNKPAI